ncbi:sensor histidine kinase [Algoriphagus zhangzhouensis]|uniref:histidine kinase n=1 Tax=Algoriphagus zhangzhouensis TaxID=1073327 RepID=A0A1M7Z9A4_9BACT|nr:ATP-binding protein [Algoriphagus zhangzhouensis]TDY47416.1 phospho-acceptor domain-containing protein [Algoriphagus zhangzhouensis]SHO61518.1 His Kinase A (phospho-acceptor) domain-containing protein [Algoriphagus zhangzhouensis]
MNLNSLRILFSVTVGILLLLCIWTYWNLSKYIETVGNIHEANFTIQTTTQVLSLIKDAETGHRGYQLSDNESYLEPYFIAKSEIPIMIDKLDSVSNYQPEIISKVDQLRVLVQNQMEIIEKILRAAKRETPNYQPEELRLMTEGKLNMDQIREVAEDISKITSGSTKIEIEEEGGFRKLTPINFLVIVLIAFGGILLLFTRAVQLLEERDKKSKYLTKALGELEEATERSNQVSRLLRNVLDSSRDGILAYEAIRNNDGEIRDFKILLANEAATLLTNRDQFKLVGQNLLEVFPGNKGYLFNEYCRVTENGWDFKSEIEYDLDGKLTWFKVLATKFEDGFVVTFSDITKEKETGIKLANYTQELKRSNEDLEQFAYVASHDLQEPLRKIRSFGDRLLMKYKGDLDENGQIYIDRMQAAAKRMQNLIEDLLAFSRITRSSELPGAVDLNLVFEEIKDDLEDQICRKNALVEVEMLPKILGVKSQVQRLFQNLVSNGMKFSRDGVDPVVKITAKKIKGEELPEKFSITPKYDNYVAVTVEDNGIGFNEKYKDQIFNVFQRLHGKNEFEGTGIGLAICKKIATHHGGGIVAESKEGVGSKFIVIFPSSS